MQKLIMAGALLGAMSFATPANALLVDINVCVTGACGGNVTVATLDITSGGANTVNFKLSNFVGALSNVDTNTAITELLFSFDGSPVLVAGDFTKTDFTAVGGLGTFVVNPPGVDAGYDFALDLDLPTSNGPNLFTDSEILEWSITKAGLAVTDFDDPVSGSGPDALAMVHIQKLDNDGSAKYVGGPGTPPPIDIPEPAALALFGAALVGLGVLRRRRKV